LIFSNLRAPGTVIEILTEFRKEKDIIKMCCKNSCGREIIGRVPLTSHDYLIGEALGVC
jgi:hypothetical protein